MITPEIRHFSNYSPAELYCLFEDIYSSTSRMSETLEEKYPDLANFESDLAVLQSVSGSITLVAEIEHKPVAYLTIRPRSQSKLSHTADLNMGVAHVTQGQGVGELILRAGLEEASAVPELEIIYLMVRADNAPAIHLYEKVGFDTMAILHRDTKIANSYFDGILMRMFVDTQSAQQFV